MTALQRTLPLSGLRVLPALGAAPCPAWDPLPHPGSVLTMALLTMAVLTMAVLNMALLTMALLTMALLTMAVLTVPWLCLL